MATLYDTLGVGQAASPDAVRKAYKRKVLETHPDKLPDASEQEKEDAERQFREVCTAFEVLSDPAKRRVYDNGLNYIRGRAKLDERQAKLAKDRQAWARREEERRQERMEAVQAEIQASRDRYKKRMEELDRARSERRMEQEKYKAAQQELREGYEKQQRNIVQTEIKYREKMQQLEVQLRGSKEKMTQNKVALQAQENSTTQVYALADEMLKQLRNMNPELEQRRQAALRRKAERMSSQDSTLSA